MSIGFDLGVYDATKGVVPTGMTPPMKSEWTVDMVSDHHLIRAYTRNGSFELFHVQLTILYVLPPEEKKI